MPDKFFFTRNGLIGNILQVIVGNRISRIQIIYSVIFILLLYFDFNAYQENKIVTTLFNIGLASYLIYKVKLSRNYSATSLIERSKIKKVKFINAKYGATRSRFAVLFEDEKGKLKTRLKLPSGSINNGERQTKEAL